MDAAGAPAREARKQGSDFARTPQFEWLARAGLVARGVIYAIVGVLAIQVAFGSGGKTTSQQGAIAEISKQTFGEALLVLMAVGLAGYAIWRLLRAALGHGPESSDDTKERVAGFASGIAYTILCVTTVSILIGSGGGSGGSPDKATGGVLDWPGGQVLVILAGVILFVVAGDQAYKGITRKFLEQSKTEEMSEGTKKAFTALGVFGHLARTVVFGLIGYFLIKAGIDYNAKESVGLDGALTAVGQAAYGQVLLGIVAAGLIGFGAYSIADARFRKV
jgi:Domain of Unknown Function (DUF1206)